MKEKKTLQQHSSTINRVVISRHTSLRCHHLMSLQVIIWGAPVQSETWIRNTRVHKYFFLIFNWYYSSHKHKLSDDRCHINFQKKKHKTKDINVVGDRLNKVDEALQIKPRNQPSRVETAHKIYHDRRLENRVPTGGQKQLSTIYMHDELNWKDYQQANKWTE